MDTCTERGKYRKRDSDSEEEEGYRQIASSRYTRERQHGEKEMLVFLISLELCLGGLIACERLSGHQSFVASFVQALLHVFVYGYSLGSSPENRSLALQQLQVRSLLSLRMHTQLPVQREREEATATV